VPLLLQLQEERNYILQMVKATPLNGCPACCSSSLSLSHLCLLQEERNYTPQMVKKIPTCMLVPLT